MFKLGALRVSWGSEHAAAQEYLVYAFAGIGALVVAWALFHVLYVVAEIHLLPGKPLTLYGANPRSRGAGSWALITGATDGIGREFAMQLARAGFNVVLVSRTASKLEAVARKIEQKYVGTKTCIYAMDFSNATEAQYAELGKITSHLDVAVLVNNVGYSHEMPVTFVESDVREMETIAELNVRTTLRVTRLIAPRLVQRGGGLVLNLGSFAGQLGVPMLATYAGTKSFLIGWTAALGEELRRANVDVQLLNTFYVMSNMSKMRASFMVPTPAQYVQAVLGRIGRSTGALGRPFTMTPYPAHAWVDWLTYRIVPATPLLRQMYTMNVDVRRRALRRAARLQKAQ